MTTQPAPTPTAAHAPHATHPPYALGHICPLAVLIKVFVALIILTVLTVVAASVNFGELNVIIAIAIAVLKGSLVVLFFMHLYWDKPFNSIVFVGCLIFVGLFISLCLLDSGQYRSSVIGGQAPLVKAVHKLPTP